MKNSSFGLLEREEHGDEALKVDNNVVRMRYKREWVK